MIDIVSANAKILIFKQITTPTSMSQSANGLFLPMQRY